MGIRRIIYILNYSMEKGVGQYKEQACKQEQGLASLAPSWEAITVPSSLHEEAGICLI